jgi:hypothetical protein
MPGEFLLKYGQQFKLDWFLLSGGARRRLKSNFLHKIRDKYAWEYYHADVTVKK